MSKRVVELFVFDIYVAIVKIEYTSEKFNNAQDLLHSYTSWDSVIREFEIIVEASKYLIKEDLLQKDHQPVVDFKNKIIHEYFGIDCEEVWNIIDNDLVAFKEVIIEIINNIDKDLKNELIESFMEDNEYLDFVILSLKKLK